MRATRASIVALATALFLVVPGTAAGQDLSTKPPAEQAVEQPVESDTPVPEEPDSGSSVPS